MDKSCLDCQKAYKISNDDQAFYSKINVPPPKSCRHCRLIRRLMERNPRRLYRRKCDFSGKEILSMYHKDQLFPVYDVEYWWGDEWDAMDFGQDIDFTRSFFDQFLEIRNQVPHTSRYVIQGTIENCDFTNCIGYAKNCYLVGECDYLEDCYYGNRLYTGKNLVDCSNCYGCELSFEIVDCRDCQRLQYSQDCQNCHDSLFLKFCIGCTDCIGCMNQRQKNFMIFNEQLTNEEYKKKKEELRLNIQSGIDVFKIKCEDFFLTQPHKYVQAEQNENCTGDHLYNSKNSCNYSAPSFRKNIPSLK